MRHRHGYGSGKTADKRVEETLQFIQQVWDVEGIKIDIKPQDGCVEHLVRAYDYDRLPDEATVDDLKDRINECINKPFITYMNF